ncbi:MAG: hypothetical protein QXI12_07430 [Candidatus Methanomethyliaceae archaeon]
MAAPLREGACRSGSGAVRARPSVKASWLAVNGGRPAYQRVRHNAAWSAELGAAMWALVLFVFSAGAVRGVFLCAVGGFWRRRMCSYAGSIVQGLHAAAL